MPAEVAGELDRLGGDGQDDLDRAAEAVDPAVPHRPRWTRWRPWAGNHSGKDLVEPGQGYWISGPTNQPGYGDHPPASWPGAPSSLPHPPITLPRPHTEPAPARAA
jgi:hypothetical protein